MSHELHGCILSPSQNARHLRPGENFDPVVGAGKLSHNAARICFMQAQKEKWLRLNPWRGIVLQHNENAGGPVNLQIAMDGFNLEVGALCRLIRTGRRAGRQHEEKKKKEKQMTKKKSAQDP
jgi:hypothetical protein